MKFSITSDEAAKFVSSLDGESLLYLFNACQDRINAEQKSLELTSYELEMLRSNRKLEAIRSIRERFSLGLVEANDFLKGKGY
jgi:ribosomal protein L7/L12